MSDIEAVGAAEFQSSAKPGPTGEPGAPGQTKDLGNTKSRSLGRDAWRELRRRPLFWIGVVLVVVFVLMAVWPRLFTSADPRACDLNDQFQPPSGAHWFGTNLQGCDVYARTVYGANASISVGVLATLIAGAIAIAVGLIAGFYGGWADGILSRVLDIILGIPLLLAALVFSRSTFGQRGGILPVVLVLGVLGWTTAARVIRSSVITAKQQDYVQAARMLGASNGRIIFRHILPNALAPTIVVLTIALGAFIATEATLSFLGAGLKDPTISWGIDISDAQPRYQEAPWVLLFPAAFLALTVLAFIMLGDAIREAFDPRLR
jgi:oligopeptide transport system permease protein